MPSKYLIFDRHWQLLIASTSLLLHCQQAGFCNSGNQENVNASTIVAISYNSEDAVAPSTGPNSAPSAYGSKSGKSVILHGKAEMTQQLDNNIQAWQASQVYKQGVFALSSKRYDMAAQYFKLAGDGFAAAGGNEKFLAESRYAEAQSRRLLGQNQAAAPLYQESIALFRQFDPLSPYLKAAVDNLKATTPPLKARIAKIDRTLKALAEASGIQAVERNIVLKGRVTDLNTDILRSENGKNSITDGYIKKTVLQAFVKMTCLETAELGSNYYTAADRYGPLKSDNKIVAIAASSGFTAPVIGIRLNGRFYNVGVDLPDLSANRRTVYLVTDGRNVLAIDPATYDVWKLYAKFNKKNADFDWRKLTHQKDFTRRITVSP